MKPQQIHKDIRRAIMFLGGEGTRIMIADIRDALGSKYSHKEVSDALWDMSSSGDMSIYRLDNPREIDKRHEEAAVHTSLGEEKHIVYFGGVGQQGDMFSEGEPEIEKISDPPQMEVSETKASSKEEADQFQKELKDMEDAGEVTNITTNERDGQWHFKWESTSREEKMADGGTVNDDPTKSAEPGEKDKISAELEPGEIVVSKDEVAALRSLITTNGQVGGIGSDIASPPHGSGVGPIAGPGDGGGLASALGNANAPQGGSGPEGSGGVELNWRSIESDADEFELDGPEVFADKSDRFKIESFGDSADLYVDGMFHSRHAGQSAADVAAQRIVNDAIAKHAKENEVDWRPNETIPEDYYAYAGGTKGTLDKITNAPDGKVLEQVLGHTKAEQSETGTVAGAENKSPSSSSGFGGTPTPNPSVAASHSGIATDKSSSLNFALGTAKTSNSTVHGVQSGVDAPETLAAVTTAADEPKSQWPHGQDQSLSDDLMPQIANEPSSAAMHLPPIEGGEGSAGQPAKDGTPDLFPWNEKQPRQRRGRIAKEPMWSGLSGGLMTVGAALGTAGGDSASMGLLFDIIGSGKQDRHRNRDGTYASGSASDLGGSFADMLGGGAGGEGGAGNDELIDVIKDLIEAVNKLTDKIGKEEGGEVGPPEYLAAQAAQKSGGHNPTETSVPDSRMDYSQLHQQVAQIFSRFAR